VEVPVLHGARAAPAAWAPRGAGGGRGRSGVVSAHHAGLEVHPLPPQRSRRICRYNSWPW